MEIYRETPNLVTIGEKYRTFTGRRKYICSVESNTMYFSTRRQCKGNPLLHFRGNTEQFCIVDSHMYVNDNRRNSLSY
jgi:hypothetical protein